MRDTTAFTAVCGVWRTGSPDSDSIAKRAEITQFDFDRFGTVGEISVIVHFIKVRNCAYACLCEADWVAWSQVGLPYLLGAILLLVLLRRFL